MKRILTLSLVLLLIGTLSSTAQRATEQGKFLYQLTNKNNNKTEVAGEELFKIEELDRGNRRITANFVAKSQEIISQYETDKLFNETITVDKDWKL
ncbi:MAG: hypothetical protein RMJ90_01750, partial [Candidatus Bipolaricaulota bacterium]|nr:hypothetical protein [Candidatus Bipolaricaulota bacterium]